jgi:hypothetical protein
MTHPISRNPGRGLRATGIAVALAATLAAAGCIQAHVAVVDRATALEQQAAGEFGGLERDLLQSGLSPRAAELTRGAIDASGVDTSRTTLDRILRIQGLRAEDDAALDDLFARHCVGEGRDGLVVETADACRGGFDAAKATPLVERANRDRRQLWAYLGELRPGDAPDAIRRAWRDAHRVTAPCGVRWQADDQSWEVKACDD